MALQPGATLAHYEIVSTLGAGGMGEVYRARDTTLGREVAVKLLLEDVATDPDRLARFEREARVLASLNHVNVATLYGLERDGDTGFLVMELVEGDTLADRIARGPLSPREAIPLFIEIAHGLEAAHEKGVIHRDLKPANIKLGGAGEPLKILDFGLAKAAGEDGARSGDSSLSMSPTLTLAATQRGEVMGTAAYMSPEQAKGLGVDRRTDVWAFGACLFEALCGERAFAGKDASELMASVLMVEPRWEALPQATPAPLRRLLRRCLEKEPRRRMRDIGDLLFELEEIRDTPAAETPTAAPARRSGAPLVTVAVAAVVALAAALAIWFLKPEPERRVVRSSLSTGSGPALASHRVMPDLAITPDGETVIYYTASGLYARRIGDLEGRLLTEEGTSPFVSPDGEWVGFLHRPSREIRKMPLSGGAPVAICRVDQILVGATWGDDDSILYASFDGNLRLVPATGGNPTVVELQPTDEVRLLRWPHWLPGSKAALITAFGGDTVTRRQVGVLHVDTGEVEILVPASSGRAIYAHNGYLLHAFRDSIFAVELDLDSLEVRGTPVPVANGLVSKGVGGTSYDVSDEGSLVYASGGAIDFVAQTDLVWADREGTATPTRLATGPWQYPSISPDGTRVAVSQNNDEQELWIWEEARDSLTRFTFDPGNDFYPVWSPDSKTLYFASNRQGTWDIYRRAVDGTGNADLVLAHDDNIFPTSITPDGRRLIYRLGTGTFDIGHVDVDDPTTAERIVATEPPELNAVLSPDGRWLAYVLEAGGDAEVFVRPYPDTDGGRWQVSTGGGSQPIWGVDGSEIFYRSGDSYRSGSSDTTFRGSTIDGTTLSNVMRVAVSTDPSFSAGTPELLFEWNHSAGWPGRNWDRHPDGERFLMTIDATPGGGAGAPEIILVQNFFAELERLVPKG